MRAKELDYESINKIIEDNTWIKYLIYVGGGILVIWIMGKSSRILGDAIFNFKHLKNAINQ